MSSINLDFQHDYIDSLDLRKIKWYKFNYQQLLKFYLKNYFSEENERMVLWHYNNNVHPYGMTKLPVSVVDEFDTYLIGTVKNNLGLETIVCAVVFCDLFREKVLKDVVTYIKYVDKNYFVDQDILTKEVSKLFQYIKNHEVLVGRQMYRDNIGEYLYDIQQSMNGCHLDIKLSYENDRNEVIRKKKFYKKKSK